MYIGKRVRTLIISESPPPGTKKDFLYNLSAKDRLRRVLSKYLGIDETELIAKLVENGVLWDMAVRCRPRDKHSINAMSKNCSYITRIVLDLLRPDILILLGRVAQQQFKSIEQNLSYRPHTIVFEKHPLYVIRFEKNRANHYFDNLASYILRTPKH